jgi:serine/threonine-protein kinase
MTLRDLPPAEFARLSALMDAALDRPAHERERWIDALAQREPGAAELLRRLVASASANADGFLETREVIERHLQRDAAAVPSLAGQSIGPWRVLRPLGRGGMGTVWLAERADGLFQRRVALKLVHQHLAQAAAERFAREREILAALDHPNIARLLDAGFAPDGRPYLALEHVEGEALTAWSDAHRLPVRERISLFLQVARAVAFAHANLVIHRDLKPSNILVTADGQARLLDFGIAKLVRAGAPEASAVTQLAGPAFTPDYASPEQIAGGPVTTTSDVYALGVVLYELLCGARPYRLARATRAALEEAILAADPVRPSHAGIGAAVADARGTTVRRLRHALAGDLDTIVMKALRKEAGARYATSSVTCAASPCSPARRAPPTTCASSWSGTAGAWPQGAPWPRRWWREPPCRCGRRTWPASRPPARNARRRRPRSCRTSCSTSSVPTRSSRTTR